MFETIKKKMAVVLSFLNSGDRWHDAGHIFFGFLLTVLIGAVTTVWWLGGVVTAVYILIKEFALDGYKGYDTWLDLTHYAISIVVGYACILLYMWVI